jgi:hypothetical protein
VARPSDLDTGAQHPVFKQRRQGKKTKNKKTTNVKGMAGVVVALTIGSATTTAGDDVRSRRPLASSAHDSAVK